MAYNYIEEEKIRRDKEEQIKRLVRLVGMKILLETIIVHLKEEGAIYGEAQCIAKLKEDLQKALYNYEHRYDE